MTNNQPKSEENKLITKSDCHNVLAKQRKNCWVCTVCHRECNIHMGNMAVVKSEEWEKDLEKINQIIKEVEQFENGLLEHLTLDSDDFTGYYGEGIPEDYFHIGFNNIKKDVKQLNKMFREILEKALAKQREEILQLIDQIEDSYGDTELEEWKAFKHIRNGIRERGKG